MQSLERFIDILEAVARSEQGLGATAVAQEIGLPVATAARLLHTMEDYGLLNRLSKRNEYVLGPRLFRLTSTAANGSDPLTAARPYLETLRDAAEETTTLHVRRGDRRICLLQVPGRHMVRRVVAVGTVEPLGSGATGAVLMSAMQKADRKAAIAEFSPTPRARRTLEELIEHVSQYGWALAPETWVPGLCGISAAVRDEGEIVATVSISGPSNRFTPEIAMSHVELLTASAHDLSLQLGAHLSETYMELGVNRSVKQARNSRTTA